MNLNKIFNLKGIIKEEDLSKRFSEMSNYSTNTINFNDAMHKLNVTNYLTPTYCDYCSQLLIGLIKQGLKCQSKNVLEKNLFFISFYFLVLGLGIYLFAM